MADVSSNTFPEYAHRGDTMSFVVTNAVTLYPGQLVGLQAGYANHWAEGANDLFAGIVMSGDTTKNASTGAEEIVGNTSANKPPEVVVLTCGVTLRGLSSVVGSAGGTITAAEVGYPVYGSTSNTDDLTLDPSGSTHAIGFLSRFTSATDVDVTLFTIGEARAHATA